MSADFDSLRVSRRRLLDFCSFHQNSVDFFRSGISFRLHEREALKGRRLRHLTSTATCLESLNDCPDIDISDHIRQFVEQALKRADWKSERSAGIYCRCRTLPFVIANCATFHPIQPHLETILYQLRSKGRYAIGEADPKDDEKDWYPPNAFHTYWTLEALARSEQRFPAEYAAFELKHKIATKLEAMVLWAWEVLGCQLGLHHINSAGLDTDQLLWALIIVTSFDATSGFSSRTTRYRDLVKHAIDTFFDAQDENTGTWKHHEPLFHYKESGNAYCYVFESLVPLLKASLRPDAVLLRTLLRPHAARLFRLLDYAESTRVPLGDGAFGWSSGHRTNMPYAESWATAAVFACMEALRRLVGIWTNEDVLKDLGHPGPIQTEESAISELLARGDTWADSGTVGEQLFTLFVNPLRMRNRGDARDPDRKPIESSQARSAILFGPPGTSKTTLARAMAAAVGWDYVELHPSHFVAGGLPNVQRTADEIFSKLMELDRCVVLFDEIDELMRERETEPDAFGRFLTTSMLPKLAELWKQRRVMYFVATNHIGHFDQALTRGERFDALIFVAPPAFSKKSERLSELITGLIPDARVKVEVTASDISKELEKINPDPDVSKGALHDENLLAKFLLLRWDQLDELANIIADLAIQRRRHRDIVIDIQILKRALKRVSDARLAEYTPYLEFLRDRARAGRDFGKELVWLVDAPDNVEVRGLALTRSNGKVWSTGTRAILQFLSGEHGVRFSAGGRVRFGIHRQVLAKRSRRKSKKISRKARP